MLRPVETRIIKQRFGVRVLVDARDQVLLICDNDPGIKAKIWWNLPGGGIEEGEHPKEAGVRELFEETGLNIKCSELVGPIAFRRVTHGYSDRILIQDEVFYRIEVPWFQPDPIRLSAAEMARGIFAQWHQIEDLPKLETWPCKLSQLLTASPDAPLNWGAVEESTVPVKPNYR